MTRNALAYHAGFVHLSVCSRVGGSCRHVVNHAVCVVRRLLDAVVGVDATLAEEGVEPLLLHYEAADAVDLLSRIA